MQTLNNSEDAKALNLIYKVYDAIVKDNPELLNDELNIFLSHLLFSFFAKDTEIFDDINSWFLAKGIPDLILSEQANILINKCGELNWSEINPDIFGSMIQAVAHPEQRSSMGMHYTSVTNILRVIEPLFLNQLYEEFEQNKDNASRLEKLLNRIYNLKIFDPACGSGNFLIIAYKELRKLEMEVFQHLQEISQQKNIPLSGIRLSQFYGIELDKFAHEMAILSLWLAEHQMNLAFAKVFGKSRPTLPLKESGNITCGNATRLDWEVVCPKTPNSEVYIIGNPPYLGAKNQEKTHKEDMRFAFNNISETKILDYVTCWIILAAKYIKNSNSQFAFVSTNSICQGEQVAELWPHIFNLNLEISFAHQSFKWTNNAKGSAGITCIILGVRNISNKTKYLFNDSGIHIVGNINAYLTNGKNIFIEKRQKPISSLCYMMKGNMAYDGGNLILYPQEKDELLEQFPESRIFIKRLYGSQEFIKGIERYCLWIENQNLDYANKIPFIKERIEKVRLLRLASPDAGGQKLSGKPHQFREMKIANNNSIIIPSVSSENRGYIPIGFLTTDSIISNLAFAIYDPEPWVFGVITSRMHMTWMRTTAGRLGTGYRYSSVLCYNTFPLPELSEQQKEEIDNHVYKILDEREKHLGKTMAQLYDPDKMPEGLKDAHHQLDLAIEKCYLPKPFESDEERLECLFKLYEEMK